MKNPKCRTCGKEHALGGCPDFQSTAVRKDAPNQKDIGHRAMNASVAGTQSLPVDTPPKPKIGRPSTGFNKKEYNRQFTADLRTIKRQGLNMKVKEWREKNDLR